ncbi:MAG: glycosyltransferase [bacterium]|nr:glycosyltransferase [bacterium]
MVHDTSTAPRVTVIITTRNEERNILPCVHAIHAQTLPRPMYVIMLVDNYSTDRTVELARPFVDTVYLHGPERSAQRNFGVAHATTPYVLYLDADMRLSPTVLEECVNTLDANPELVALYIPEKIVGTGFWIAVRNFERSFYDATVVDAVRFIRRDAFLATGGFDTSLCGPEDWDLDRRLATHGRFALITAPLYHDEGAFSFRRYLRKKAYYAQSFAAYAHKWQHDAVVRKQLGAWYRFIGVFIEQGKWRRLLRHPLLGAGMYLLRFLVGCSFLLSKFTRAKE